MSEKRGFILRLHYLQVNIGLLIGAHWSTSTSTSSQSLCDAISVNGLHNSMANVWSLHMYNQRQRMNNFDEIEFIFTTPVLMGRSLRDSRLDSSHTCSVLAIGYVANQKHIRL